MKKLILACVFIVQILFVSNIFSAAGLISLAINAANGAQTNPAGALGQTGPTGPTGTAFVFTNLNTGTTGVTGILQSPVVVIRAFTASTGTTIIDGDLLVGDESWPTGILAISDGAKLIINGDLFVNGRFTMNGKAVLKVKGDAFLDGSFNTGNYISISGSFTGATGNVLVHGDITVKNYTSTGISRPFLLIRAANITGGNIFIENNRSDDASSASVIQGFSNIEADSIIFSSNRCTSSSCTFLLHSGSNIVVKTINFEKNSTASTLLPAIQIDGFILANEIDFNYNVASGNTGVVVNTGTLNTDIIKVAQSCTGATVGTTGQNVSLVGVIQKRETGAGIPYIRYLFNAFSLCANANYTGNFTGL